MNDPRHQRGLEGERLAERHLRRLGLTFVTRRFRTSAGELDLVFREKQTIVFVEVKTQRDDRLIDPQERVTRSKRQRLLRAARAFLVARRWTDRPLRFDVVSVLLPDSGPPTIRHDPDAFAPTRW